MVFDSIDIEFLKLCGLCRYIPSGLEKRYDAAFLKKSVIANLKMHGVIKMQSDLSSYKLTTSGRDILAGIGYEFPKDARTNIHKDAYKRKLISAELSLVMYFADIDVFYKYPKELAGINEGYASTLIMRADKNMKVLSGSRFLGIYKNGDTAYIPYNIENEESRILPNFEKSMFMSQIDSMKSIKSVKLMLFARTLEELWSAVTTQAEHKTNNGRKIFKDGLEEIGLEYLLIPYGRNGVTQLSVIRDCRCRQRIASAAGCIKTDNNSMPDCDGIRDESPYIIAIDMNVQRILKALKQVYRVDKNIVPTICCLPFQKSTILKILKRYGCQKTAIKTVETENLQKIFPKRNLMRKEYITEEGEYIEAPPKITKAFEEEWENI